MTATGLYIALSVAQIALLALYSRNGTLFRCVFFTLITGFLSLALVVFLSRFLSFGIAFTPFSALVSGVLGVPGVLGLLLMNLV